MMFRNIVVGYCCSIIVLIVASCDRDLGLGPGDYNNITTIVYSQHVQPLFTQRCATSGCHNAATAAEDFVLSSWESLMMGSEHGAMVIPFRPEKSHLIFHVNGDTTVAPVAEPRMPPDKPLSGEEVAFLMRWIREGAKNDFGWVAFDDPQQGRVLVTNQADDEVAVIDAANNLLVRMVSVGEAVQPEAPHNITLDPLGDFYYINLIVGNEILKFDAKTNELLGTLSLGSGRSPAQIALSPDGMTGYVTNFHPSKTPGSVQRFNAQTMTLTDEILDQRIKSPHGVSRKPGTNAYWVACEQSDNIAILLDDDIIIVKVDSTVPDLPVPPARFGPYQTVFTPDGAFAYVTCRFSDEVRVFDTETLELVSVIPVGNNPLIPGISPEGDFVYVANRNDNSVSVIFTENRTEIDRIEDVGVEPHGVVVSPDGKYVYVSCENVNNPDAPHHPVAGLKTPGIVAVIDAATNTVIERIEVGAFAAGIAFLPSK